MVVAWRGRSAWHVMTWRGAVMAWCHNVAFRGGVAWCYVACYRATLGMK